MKANLTTIILTFNEEKNIKQCIESVKIISDRIIIVDSYSTDRTLEIAQEFDVEIVQNEFINQSKQFQFAIDTCNILTTWILRLDADERLTNASRQEIVDFCRRNEKTEINGLVLRFEVNFLGKKLRHGGIYPFRKLSLFKNGKGKIEDRNMDEHIILTEGRYEYSRYDSLHEDYKNLSVWIDKHNKYSSRETMDYFSKKENYENQFLDNKSKIKRLIKEKIYYKMPMSLRAKLYYIYRFYIKLGFLDGKEGQIFAFLQAYWYRYLVDAKIYEKQKRE